MDRIGKLLALTALAVGVGVAGCGDDSSDGTGGTGNSGGSGGSGGTGAGGEGGSAPLTPAEEVDLLLAIDNSRSMADKQAILALAVPDVVASLVNPRCIDPAGAMPPVVPAGPLEECPAGMERQFTPVLDLHIGVISSSLGGHGADACAASTPATASNNDKGQLLARTAPANGSTIETYQNKGYLAWDPAQKLMPVGEADLDADSSADPDTTALIPQLRDMVLGVGEVGCGFESQLESWYRFLVDPEPYETITVDSGVATPQGVDTVLLAQRADFLRPHSLLAILQITDENDCSTREGGQFYFANQLNNANGTKFHLPRPRSECATNPNDPCCVSCGQQTPQGCPADPSCTDAGGMVASLTDLEDPPNLRCFDQKRRFGIDFLYPIERYVDALTQAQITNRAGELVPNPIFTDLNPDDGYTGVRDPGLVFLTGIVGVPWQDLARLDANGMPDLLSGLDAAGNPVGGFKGPNELAATWDVILGDPGQSVFPADPHMVESIDPRSGTNPITGTEIAPPGSPNGANEINGHEYEIPERNDLQYACIFDLPPGAERDCSIPGQACDCFPGSGDGNPLCEPNPNDLNNPTLQVRAKAYPGLRELEVLKGLGAQGITGSVCPAQVSDPSQADFGYRPAIGALIERVSTRL